MHILWPLLSLISVAHASVTVYSQRPIGSTPTQAASANYTGAAAYDPTVLQAPAVPNPAPPTQFSLQLNNAPNGVQGLSIPQSGAFMGFSIEFSVINQIREFWPLRFFAFYSDSSYVVGLNSYVAIIIHVKCRLDVMSLGCQLVPSSPLSQPHVEHCFTCWARQHPCRR